MQKKFTNPIPVVDVICYHGFNDNLIAIGRKKIDGLYRLPGGFIDNNETDEQAAIRELYEETFLVDDEEPILIGTYVVNDWRYNCEPNNLLSLLYVTQAINPNDLDASDDLNEVFWADADFILTNKEKFVKIHFKMIKEHFIDV